MHYESPAPCVFQWRLDIDLREEAGEVRIAHPREEGHAVPCRAAPLGGGLHIVGGAAAVHHHAQVRAAR